MRIGTARMKYDIEAEEEGGKRRVRMVRSKAGTKMRSPDGLTIARAYGPPGVAAIRSSR